MLIRNVEVLENLGIKDKPAQQKVQANMAHVAAARVNRIVPHRPIQEALCETK